MENIEKIACIALAVCLLGGDCSATAPKDWTKSPGQKLGSLEDDQPTNPGGAAYTKTLGYQYYDTTTEGIQQRNRIGRNSGSEEADWEAGGQRLNSQNTPKKAKNSLPQKDWRKSPGYTLGEGEVDWRDTPGQRLDGQNTPEMEIANYRKAAKSRYAATKAKNSLQQKDWRESPGQRLGGEEDWTKTTGYRLGRK